MILRTEHLGDIEYSENDIINFPKGIPGFEDEKEFILIPTDDIEFPFNYLQSVKSCDLAFIVTDPFLFVTPYDFELSDVDATFLSLKNETDLQDISFLSIVTIPDEVENTTINIMAPIVINHNSKMGKQILLTEFTDTKYPLFLKNEA